MDPDVILAYMVVGYNIWISWRSSYRRSKSKTLCELERAYGSNWRWNFVKRQKLIIYLRNNYIVC